MPKTAKVLTYAEIRRLGLGTYNIGGVTGLYVRKTHNRSYYFLRYSNATGRHDLVLGKFELLSLSQARQLAVQFQLAIMRGDCPVKSRQLEKVKMEPSKKIQQKALTFEQVAEAWLDSCVKDGRWQKDKRGVQNTRRRLENYAYKFLGNKSIETIEAPDIKDCLSGIWQTKADTANKLKRDLSEIFRWASATKLRTSSSNPADMNGPLGILLKPLQIGRKSKQHFAACPVEEIPQLFVELGQLNSISARACEFSILTAARSQAVRLATWDEIDLTKRIWTIPSDHDKIKTPGRDRRIFLSEQAIRLLKQLPRLNNSQIIFFNTKGEPLSDTALTMCLRGLHENRLVRDKVGWIDPIKTEITGKASVITLHGTARASFRTWAESDEFGNNRELDQNAAELCLLHSKNDEYGEAYNRADFVKERRLIMQCWGNYCLSKCSDNISVQLKKNS